MKAQIFGTGSHLPSRVLSNREIETMVETSDDWIKSRTGIHERRISEKGESASDLGSRAAAAAIKNSGVATEKIGMIVVATSTPDMFFPSTACLIQGKLGIRNAFAFDISAACSGFIYAVSIAEKFIRAGTCEYALVVGTEVMSGIVDWTDRNTCVLFGDGAGAVVLGRSLDDSSGIIYTSLYSDGNYSDLIEVPGGGSRHPYSAECLKERLPFIKMKGNETFKIAVKYMTESIISGLHKAGLELSDISLVIPHQANLRIISAVAEKLEISPEKMFINLAKYGNTSAASVPIALDEAWHQEKIKRGDIILLCGFGSGLTGGVNIIRW